MNNTPFVILVLIMALSVQLTRFLPFLIFGKNKDVPKIVEYFGKVLPAATMGLLVIYCFKDVDYSSISSILPTVLASITVIAIHLWKRNTIVSISVGTIIYMILLRLM
ncbi:MAG: AzlD domain-containing protein [Erysipelotrichaceae bacterium]|nr:AzlD domain-containing protein [Erysipelotrichaceae bacterium]